MSRETDYGLMVLELELKDKKDRLLILQATARIQEIRCGIAENELAISKAEKRIEMRVKEIEWARGRTDGN